MAFDESTAKYFDPSGKPTAAPAAPSQFDESTAVYKPPPRSALGEIGSQLKASVMAEVPKQFGQALQYISDPGQGLYEYGKGVAESATEREKQAQYVPEPEEHGAVVNALASGARMLGPSIAPPLAAAGALALLPEAAGGAALGAGAAGLARLAGITLTREAAKRAAITGIASVAGTAPGALQQGEQTLEKAREAGVPDEIAIPAARKTAGIEAAGEFASNIIGGRVLGAIPGAAKGVFKPWLRHTAEALALEPTTEYAQQYGQTAVERAAGISTEDPHEQGLAAMPPAAGMVALLAPLGLAGHAMSRAKPAAQPPPVQPPAGPPGGPPAPPGAVPAPPGAPPPPPPAGAAPVPPGAAPAPPGAPPPPAAPTPTGAPVPASALLQTAEQRLTELSEKANGTPDQTAPGPDGRPITVPGKVPEYLSDAEQDELDFLQQHSANPAELARRAGVTIGPEPPAPAGPVTKAATPPGATPPPAAPAPPVVPPTGPIGAAVNAGGPAAIVAGQAPQQTELTEAAQAQSATKAEEAQTAAADLDSRLDALGAERQKLRDAGTTHKDPLAQALSAASSVSWEHAEAVKALKWAMQNGRQDIADALIERSQRIAKRAAAAMPGLEPDSPKYAAAQAELAAIAKQASEEAGQLENLRRLHARPDEAAPTPAPAGPIAAPSQAFESAEEANTRAAQQTEEGTPSKAIPHPTQPGAFAVVPDEAAAPAPEAAPAPAHVPTAQDVAAAHDLVSLIDHGADPEAAPNHIQMVAAGLGLQVSESETPQALVERIRAAIGVPAPAPAPTPVERRKAPTEGPRERRADTEQRKRVAEMTPEEMRQELLVNPVSGIANRRAYEEKPTRKAVQVSIDVDGLKWVNDHMGHEEGNKLLRAVGQALNAETVSAYHFSGDEFVIEAQSAAEADQVMKRAMDALASITIAVTLPDGTVRQITGIGVGHGKGRTLEEADRALAADKAERTATGKRAERGEKPPGATEIAPAGKQDQVGKPPEEEVTGTSVADLEAAIAEGKSNADLIPTKEPRTKLGMAKAMDDYEAELEAAGWKRTDGHHFEKGDASLFLRSQGPNAAPIVQWKAKKEAPAPAAPAAVKAEDAGKVSADDFEALIQDALKAKAEAAKKTSPRDLIIDNNDGDYRRGYDEVARTLAAAPRPIKQGVQAVFDHVVAEQASMIAGGAPLMSSRGAKPGWSLWRELAVTAVLVAKGKRTIEGATATVAKNGNKRTLTTPWGTFELERKNAFDKLWMMAYRLPAIPAKKRAPVTPQVAALPGMTPLGAKPTLGKAAKEAVEGLEEGLAGLDALFGRKGTLGSGPVFDEETWAKAKPHFDTAYSKFVQAGKSLAEFVRYIIDTFNEAILPYLRHWHQQLTTALGGGKVKPDDTTTATGGAGRLPAVGEKGVPTGGEAGNIEPGAPGADVEKLGAGKPGAVRPPEETGDLGAGGGRAAGEDVAGGGKVPTGGGAVPGQQGASGAGVAADGPGTRGPAGGERQPDPPKQPGLGNYHITDPEALVGGGPKARFGKNRAAIEVLNRLRDENREATALERDTLAAYTGWGSYGQELFQGTWARDKPAKGWEAESTWLREHMGQEQWESAQRSILNAHYTDPPTVASMWQMITRMGFTGGRVLEPSYGAGTFYGMMPRDVMARSQLAGIELDELTGRIGQILYPDANMQIKGYEASKTADGFYDLILGNWPFAAEGPSDRRYNALSPSLHDYFFVKALDQVRAGGLVIGITSNGTMDKQGKVVRRELARKGELIAAFRLPTGAFQKYAGTKVVTDILILRKRAQPIADPSKEGWLELADFATPQGNTIQTNEYWLAHPENVLGQMNWGHGTTSGRPGMIVDRESDFPEKLAGLAQRLPADVYAPAPRAQNINYVANQTTERESAVTVNAKGELHVVRGEYLAPLHEVATNFRLKAPSATAKREAQVKGLIGLRKAYGALIDAERHGTPDVEALRSELNKQARAFVRAHGAINESYGLKLFKKIAEPNYPLLAALEIKRKAADGTVTWSPARILTQPTMRGKAKLENPSVTDAFVLARQNSLHVDMAEIARIAKRPEAEVIAELTKAGAVFQAPAGHYEVADVYLSGNVRRKLREAEEAAAAGQDMARNIEALKKVMPEDTPYYKIEAKLGAPWVPAADYKNFVHELLGLTSQQEKEAVEIEHRLGSWRVDIENDRVLHKPEATTVHGVPFYPFDRLLKAAMNNTAIVIRYRDNDGNMIVDQQQSTEANLKAGALRERFPDWLWSDMDRRLASEHNYNEAMNAIADPSFDGSFLNFPGMALQKGITPFSLREHQANAIWRGLVNKLGIYAHEVGTGKTFTMAGLAVEARRYGVAKKPLLLAHNANSATVAREINEMYPGARVLYLDNLDPSRIDITMRQIANDDWDAIVMPHSLIDRFGFREETLQALAAEEIAALEQEALDAAADDGANLSPAMMDDERAMAGVRSSTAKELVKARNAILNKIADLAARASRENAVPFEDLGIDMVMVDEAHTFKKPPLATKMNLKGLNKGTSNRSITLRFLTDYVKGMNGGTGVHLFTGTPITNTLNEIYNMQRFVADAQMARDGIKDWDSWFNTFADSLTDVELTAAATYEPVTRLASFVNTAELRRMIGGYTDIVFANDMPEFKPRETASGKNMASTDLTDEERAELLNGRSADPIGRPYKQIVNDVAAMSPAQSGMLEHLVQLATMFKNAGKKARRDMMLAGHPASPVIVETDAAKAGLDPRLYDLEAPDHPDLKINRAARNILTHYNEHAKATQVVFVERGYNDMAERSVRTPDGAVVRDANNKALKQKVPTFNLTKGLIDKLVEGGIPREQIAIVSGETSKEKRKEIADLMNTAEIRVVIGLTNTLGTGVNMQDNLRAIHHLDAPWMPGELEQRNGRGWRQGNQWNTLLEYRYITDRIDGRRWQVLAVKDRFIKAFLTADKTVRTIEGDAASMDEEGDILSTLGEAAGDPRLLLLQKYKNDVDRLANKQRFHDYARQDAAQRIPRVQDQIGGLERQIGHWTADQAKYHAATAKTDPKQPAPFSAEISNKAYGNAHEFDTAIADYIKKEITAPFTEWRKVGNIHGFNLYFRWPHLQAALQVELRGKETYSALPVVASMEGVLRGIGKRIETAQTSVDSLNQSIPRLQEAANAPFQRAGDLTKKRQLLNQLEADLALNPVPAPVWLRQGAPIKTLAYVGGKPYEIAGHQWAQDNFYVIVDTPKGVRRVPYDRVQDDQGLAVFEAHPHSAPPRPPPFIKPGTMLVARDDATKIYQAQASPTVQNGIRIVRVVEVASGEVSEQQTDKLDFLPVPEPAPIPTLEGLRDTPIAMGMAGPRPTFRPRRRYAEARDVLLWPAPRLSAKPAKQGGMSAKRVEAALKPILDKWKNRPPVEIVQSLDDLPAELRNDPVVVNALAEGSSVGGLIAKGKVWIIADSTANAEEAQRTLLHEVVGHHGLAGLLGGAKPLAMQFLYDNNSNVKAQADELTKRYGYDTATATEEVLADMAGAGKAQELKGWKWLAAQIRHALRKLGFTVKYTDNDIAALLAESQRYVEGGRPSTQVDEQTRLAARPAWVQRMNPQMQAALGKAGVGRVPKTLRERYDEFMKDAGLKVLQGTVDRFAPVLHRLGEYAYKLLRMSTSYDAGLEAALMKGRLTVNQAGALDIQRGTKGLMEILKPLHGEIDRFLPWIAGHRAAQLAREDRENLFGDVDIDELKTLNQKLTADDNFADGTDGRERARIYNEVLREFNLWQKAILDVAEKNGVIKGVTHVVYDSQGNFVEEFKTRAEATAFVAANPQFAGGRIGLGGRALWEKSFYVPFYREREGETLEPGNSSGYLNPYAFKRLKGGKEVLHDLFANVVHNASHLIQTSLKNKAAMVTLDAAAALTAPSPTPGGAPVAAPVARIVPRAEKGSNFILRDGKKEHWMVDDPLIFDSLASLELQPFRGPAMKFLTTLKQMITFGVTASPTYRVRNVIRDQVSAIATNPISMNFVKNGYKGFQFSAENNPEYGTMLAGGAFFRLGLGLEGDRAKALQKLVRKHGIDPNAILDTPAKVKAMFGKAWDWYQKTGERSESITRATVYQQHYERAIKPVADGGLGLSPDMAHFEASYAARDVLDFSLHGRWPAIRWLTQVVPFMNTRAQGLYKLQRGAKEDPRRFWAAVGGITLATVALMLYNRGDPDWEKRDEWDRDNFWWFKIGDQAMLIPKPFEIGALATVVERITDASLNGLGPAERERFAASVMRIVGYQLNMNPVPQAVWPAIQLWANKDSFFDRSIESMHDANLSPAQRIGPYTTATAQALTHIAKIPGVGQLSPEQIDFLVRAYFGWVGSHALLTADFATRPLMGIPERAERRTEQMFFVGDFVKDLPTNQSRFIQQFYDHLQEVQQAIGDVHQLQKIGKAEEAAALRKEKAPLIAVHSLYGHTQRELAKLNQQLRYVESSALSPEAKRERIDRLSQQKIMLAERAERARATLEARE